MKSVRCRMCDEGNCRSLGRIGGFPFWECEGCELTFTPLARREVRPIYRDGCRGMNDWAPTEECADPSFLEPLWPLCPPGPLRVLDFGCGRSTIASTLRARGHRTFAVDVSPPEDPAHPDRLTGTLPELDLPAESFDLVYSFGAFEELPHPRPELDRLRRLLRRGGLLAISTEMETPERRNFNRWWYVAPPDRCSFYRNRTFATWAKAGGDELAYADDELVAVRRSH